MGEVKRFTLAEVRGRHGRGGAPVWMVYKDDVYDVTGFVPEHPGGDVILEEAGMDATRAFEDAGHSKDARTIMSKLKIGELVEEEKIYDANGKKRKIVVPKDSTPDEQPGGRSCLAVCTCGILG